MLPTIRPSSARLLITSLCLSTLCLATGRAQNSVSPSDLVHPLIGTAAEGQTFPIAGVPFAMTDWTPQTRDGEIKCVPPYLDADTKIQGFRGSHFLSGSCTQDYGSFTLMPVSGPLKLSATDRATPFTHAAETAHPYLYAVDLPAYGIRAELTGTARSGLMRFRYNHPGHSWLVLQTNSRPGGGPSSIHIDAIHHELSGSNAVTRIYAGDGKPAGFSGYFVIQFDHPFRSATPWDPANPSATGVPAGAPGAYLDFDLHPGEALQLRIGTSFTSIDEARRNLAAEIPTWDFAHTVALAHAAWDAEFNKIRIAGDAPQRHVFYTAMYHAFTLPRVFSDVDGSYPSFSTGHPIHTAIGFTYYDDYSIWDTFRDVHPLITLLDPDRERQMISSLIAKGTQGGYLPIYPAWNSYTTEMIGDHADAIIFDGYAKGIRGFDIDEAYRLMRHNALDTPPQLEYIDGEGRRALTSYLKYGYIPLEDHVPYSFHKDEQVSRTLEYAYDDFLISRFALALHKPDDAKLFDARGNNWRNVIDPSTGFARGRHADGSWVTPFDPTKPATYVTEALPFQYTFFVPQDIPGLIERLHGPSAFTARLDELFAKNLYDQGNEPSHHIAFLYNFSGAAAKTQQHARSIMDTQYTDRPAGLAGNDDCGQMSAWYIMAALGLYPITPGLPTYELSTPRFDDTTLTLPSGRKLHILAPGTESGAIYIRSVTLNGKPITTHSLTHDQLLQGGELRFTLSKTPVSTWPAP
jgi:predicted alpha-1,2-mannosidase